VKELLALNSKLGLLERVLETVDEETMAELSEAIVARLWDLVAGDDDTIALAAIELVNAALSPERRDRPVQLAPWSLN
jgi:hypothetical protein